ncbi:AAA family ATPase [Bradyrhizobium guangzhouense]|uniref:ATPase n=1 Tax=Bradyrhizobium guangzhouense TaxID=1325095 RepID=A0AAE5WWS0_9BRAD|nr:AAA family ATPase [Bradyrhizobium guangzhouense]QAU44345.1 ATPase [Bradyrhizobium guangzhouense]RXH09350.1 AAA family ATPase [Bradyrhizobium guangzhouense]RXH10085.1 AAA family ATPase [Bradyrhizobium guangzhouense]
MSSTGDKNDDFDLPTVESDDVLTGAAADSADSEDQLKGLPRVLRYAKLIGDHASHIEKRLIAEIHELCPDLVMNVGSDVPLEVDAGLALATELDRRAVKDNDPNLRSLSDSVRLLCLPAPREGLHSKHYFRVAKALLLAFENIRSRDDRLCCEIERFVFGWAALPTCAHMVVEHESAAANALRLGSRMVDYRIAAAWKEGFESQKEALRSATNAAQKDAEPLPRNASDDDNLPPDHVIVARLSADEMKNFRVKELLGPLKNVVNVPLPLVTVPPLHEVRHKLLLEFPYAERVIDLVLSDLVGRRVVQLRPIILVGEPGGGKSRFARCIGQALGLHVWRTDCSRADAAFAGTDRRWHTAEPCHPFLAIVRSKTANPMVLLDELEKAPSSSNLSVGRLWDCLLSFTEAETSARYPDPALQINVDLSRLSFIATVNNLDPLPGPIRDRFVVVKFPKPAAEDLDALLPAVMTDLAKERGLDERWIRPLNETEHTAVARLWQGGSVRRLRRIVEVILRERDLSATRN